MINLTLGDKKHYLPYISARALREIGPMEKMYARASQNEALGSDDMDAAIDWLCVLFNHAFTPDDVLDNYPMASFWVDVFTISSPCANRWRWRWGISLRSPERRGAKPHKNAPGFFL